MIYLRRLRSTTIRYSYRIYFYRGIKNKIVLSGKNNFLPAFFEENILLQLISIHIILSVYLPLNVSIANTRRLSDADPILDNDRFLSCQNEMLTDKIVFLLYRRTESIVSP